MNGNFRLGTLFGIPFYVNVSWFVVLLLVTASYGGQLAAQFPSLTGAEPWLLGLVAALLLFASVVAHELGHSLVAMRQGIEVKSITLFLFGGVARLGQESKSPRGALAVAIAGPAVSVALWAMLTAMGLSLPVAGPVAGVLALLAMINLYLALFNMIPGLPLDGGNVLKAIVWQVTGNRYRGIRVAARGGQVVGGLAIAIGLLGLRLWPLLIGGFLLQNANQVLFAARVEEKLSRFTAADLVTEGHLVVNLEDSLRQVGNAAVPFQGKVTEFLVRDAAGQLMGRIELEQLKQIPTSQWPWVTVAEIVQPAPLPTVIQGNQSLLDIAKLFEQQNLPALAVVNESGILLGLLEKANVRRFVQEKLSYSNRGAG